MNLLLPRSIHWIVPLIILAIAIAVAISGLGGIAPAIRESALDIVLGWFPAGERAAITRLPNSVDVELGFLAVTGSAVAILLGRAQITPAVVATLTAIVLAALLSWRVAAEAQLLFDPGYPAAALVCVFLSGIGIRTLNASLGRRHVRRSLSPHLGPDAVETVSERPDLLRLQGQRKSISYLVCRIRDYAAIADAYSSDVPGLSELTRRIMSPIAQAVLEKGGTIDHLVASGLTAFFNAPLDDPEHGLHACECALRMRDEVEKANRVLEQERRPDGKPVAPIELCVAINTGECAIGNFGTRARSEYSIAGRAAEFARDLELLALKYGPTALVGEETRNLTERNFAYLEVDTLERAPEGRPVPIFALLGSAALKASPKFRALQTFHYHILKAYRAREWERTRKLIEQCRALSGTNLVLYKLYEDRIAYLKNHPPGEDWDGVFRPPQT